MSQPVRTVVPMFFERHCPVCGADHRRICPACSAAVRPAPCVQVIGVRHLIALLAYDQHSAPLVLAGKNGGRRDLLRWSGAHLAAQIARTHPSPTDIDLVSWVPAHPAQRRSRGYDQGEILARSVARHLGLRCRSTLRRAGGASRKGLARSARLDGPEVRARRRTSGSVLLVDDVVTTGTTLRRCAEALSGAGATNVDAAVLAASGFDSPGPEEERPPIIYIGAQAGIRQRTM